MESVMDDTGRYVRGVILAWEKLRVVYTGVLIVEGFVFPGKLWNLGAPFVGYWSTMIWFAVIANAFYCLGPLLDIYACVVLGRRTGRARYLLFGAGLLFSTGVVVILWRLIP